MASNISPGFPTPPTSSAAPSQHASPLPQPRRHPLKPGGARESDLIRYLDNGVNQVQKRVDNRSTYHEGQALPGDEGYAAFADVAKDLEALVDVIWVSGSPNLQMPYLLNIAVLTTEFLPLFPSIDRSSRATFSLLSKLDYAFASLLMGRDSASGEDLPGFEEGRGISTTDKVRLKGVVDRTRLIVVRVMSRECVVGEDDDATDTMDTDTEKEDRTPHTRLDGTFRFEGFDAESENEEDEEELQERDIGKIYESTISELGDVLGGPPIGIITEDWASKTAIREPPVQMLEESDGEMADDEVEL